jgi:hypothetical protein
MGDRESEKHSDSLKVGIAQIAPVWLNRDETIGKSDITRFIAKEGRSYVLSASGLMRKADIPLEMPHSELILANSPELTEGLVLPGQMENGWWNRWRRRKN